ncbi:hypothetical protein J2S43_007416 [Catenuloplanes nepalensis]|uniref:Uncharacterized protein n=1 Tax=Catenuloplanes nepalensis TaxID=587533 RepID=A0ABT9N5F4_9ACTN|nr:hypothetical protein [Catenuloplanes nepalensis]MDP9798904.1 hypothetical protein [Catenuloplanes nepalensis]
MATIARCSFGTAGSSAVKNWSRLTVAARTVRSSFGRPTFTPAAGLTVMCLFLIAASRIVRSIRWHFATVAGASVLLRPLTHSWIVMWSICASGQRPHFGIT